MSEREVDILENALRHHKDLLDILLTDQTRLKDNKKDHNIIWATNSYPDHKPTDQIKIEDITGTNTHLIQPRISKSRAEQKLRTQEKAEVFTPKNIVQEMNQQIDWTGDNWPVTETNWQNYVSELKLEITCGEAPFIVGRYNASNGRKVLKLEDRVGFLDRKLQTVSKFAQTKNQWIDWAIKAYQASYGYEWQGDNLLLARENLLYTFIDYWNEKFPNDKINLERQVSNDKMSLLSSIAKIISWNIFQMDGLKYVIPMSCENEITTEEVPPLLRALGEVPKTTEKTCLGCLHSDPFEHNGKYVYIMDWQTNKTKRFVDLIKKR